MIARFICYGQTELESVVLVDQNRRIISVKSIIESDGIRSRLVLHSQLIFSIRLTP